MAPEARLTPQQKMDDAQRRSELNRENMRNLLAKVDEIREQSGGELDVTKLEGVLDKQNVKLLRALEAYAKEIRDDPSRKLPTAQLLQHPELLQQQAGGGFQSKRVVDLLSRIAENTSKTADISTKEVIKERAAPPERRKEREQADVVSDLSSIMGKLVKPLTVLAELKYLLGGRMLGTASMGAGILAGMWEEREALKDIGIAIGESAIEAFVSGDVQKFLAQFTAAGTELGKQAGNAVLDAYERWRRDWRRERADVEEAQELTGMSRRKREELERQLPPEIRKRIARGKERTGAEYTQAVIAEEARDVELDVHKVHREARRQAAREVMLLMRDPEALSREQQGRMLAFARSQFFNPQAYAEAQKQALAGQLDPRKLRRGVGQELGITEEPSVSQFFELMTGGDIRYKGMELPREKEEAFVGQALAKRRGLQEAIKDIWGAPRAADIIEKESQRKRNAQIEEEQLKVTEERQQQQIASETFTQMLDYLKQLTETVAGAAKSWQDTTAGAVEPALNVSGSLVGTVLSSNRDSPLAEK